MEFVVPSNVREATLELVVIRADGTKEDLGVVAEYNRDEKEDE